MPTGHEIRLTRFSFPGDLDEDKQDFRLQVDLRYREGSAGNFSMMTVILPGLGLYWECSERQRDALRKKPRPDRVYARKDSADGVAVDKVGAWDTVFRLKASDLYEMRVTVLTSTTRVGGVRSAMFFVTSVAFL